MCIGMILDYVFDVVIGCAGQSWMIIEGSQWFLIVEEGFGLLPCLPPLDGLVVDLFLQFHVGIVDQGAQLFLDQSDIVFGVFAGEVDVPHDFVGLQGHSFGRNGIKYKERVWFKGEEGRFYCKSMI